MARPAIDWYSVATPNTTGMSRPGRGSNAVGVNRLRGEMAEIAGTLAWTRRMSLNVSPGEIARILFSVCQSVASRASTIRLRTPRFSMNAMTCCCAPAPIDSMATTAATPQIIPSIVRSDRSLCASRFSRPMRTSGPSRDVQICVRRGREAGAFIAHLPRPAALLAPVRRHRSRRDRGARQGRLPPVHRRPRATVSAPPP